MTAWLVFRLVTTPAAPPAPADRELGAMLDDPDAQVRAQACKTIGEQPGTVRDPLPLLVARTADADFRVRSAAYVALDRLRDEPTPLPSRDTPLARREEMLLDWLKTHHGTDKANSPLSKLCEVFADSRFIELGTPILNTCLACHAAPAPSPAAAVAGESCIQCHSQITHDHLASSHAQSLSHIQIKTVNPQTRQVEWASFGDKLGIHCTACHNPASEKTSTPADPACRFTFQTGASCATCHADAQSQWEKWLAGPQPRRASWPPGQIKTDSRGDTRSCVDCHMPRGKSTPRTHILTARRDPQLLQSGIDLRIKPREIRDGKPVVPVVLTNLAGHDYPTGTRRRSLELVAQWDESEPQLIAELVPRTLDIAEKDVAPALAPGEQRTFLLHPPGENFSLIVRLNYVRNRFDDETLVVEVSAQSLTR